MKKYIVMLILFMTCVLYAEYGSIIPRSYPQLPGESVAKHHFGEEDPWHNSSIPFLDVRDTTELAWDDGIPEGYFIVSFPPGIYDRFAVRFRSPYTPPMKVIGGRFYTDNSSIPLQSFSVCRDAGGFPDVFNPVDQVDTVYGGFPGWGSYEFHGALFDTNDIWAVVHWIPGFVTGIGTDSTAPDDYSYWCNEKTASNWNHITGLDWMLRLSVAEVTDSHDVTCVSVLEPPGRFLPGDTTHPTAVFGNCGLSAETFDVTFDILDSTSTLIYTSTTSLTLASAEVETVTFSPEWVEVNEGMYDYVVYTSLSGDIDPANDTLYRQGLCSREIIITYCGDYTNMGSAIIGTWATNRKYMVRMTPPVSPPYYLRRAQIFLCDAYAPIEYLCVSPDNGSGLPDTATIYAISYNISVTQDRTWASTSYGDVEVTQPGDIWLIEKWPEGITEPHIGMEINDPSTERCWRYYFRNGAGHYENMGQSPYFREWYFRLIIAVPPLGVEEVIGKGNSLPFGLSCQPNPSRNSITITCNTGILTEGELRIYDATGRIVKSFSPLSISGLPSAIIIWDGTNDNGKELPAGIYFVQLESAGRISSRKVVLLQ